MGAVVEHGTPACGSGEGPAWGQPYAGDAGTLRDKSTVRIFRLARGKHIRGSSHTLFFRMFGQIFLHMSHAQTPGGTLAHIMCNREQQCVCEELTLLYHQFGCGYVDHCVEVGRCVRGSFTTSEGVHWASMDASIQDAFQLLAHQDTRLVAPPFTMRNRRWRTSLTRGKWWLYPRWSRRQIGSTRVNCYICRKMRCIWGPKPRYGRGPTHGAISVGCNLSEAAESPPPPLLGRKCFAARRGLPPTAHRCTLVGQCQGGMPTTMM